MAPAAREGSEAGPRIGVLALQGDFAAHAAALSRIGCNVFEVRRSRQLVDLEGLVIPGGESTTLLRLLARENLDAAIREFHGRGGHLLATCAGLILLAREVRNPAQPSLGILDVVVERNGFGRQRESFVDTGVLDWPGRPSEPIEMVFIRAPRLVTLGAGVEVRAHWRGEPVLCAAPGILAATFHPELSPGGTLHRQWVEDWAQLRVRRVPAGSASGGELWTDQPQG